MKTKMMMLCLTLLSWGVYAQHDHTKSGHDMMSHDKMKMDKKNMGQNMVMFKDANLGTAYEHYIRLKDALVASNKDQANSVAGELQKSLEGISNGKMVADEVAKVISAANLEEQRKAFSGVSDMMTMLVKDGKLSKGMIYLDYCPMANDSEGAYWLSNEKEIKNPYLGEKMMTCGSVKEMIH